MALSGWQKAVYVQRLEAACGRAIKKRLNKKKHTCIHKHTNIRKNTQTTTRTITPQTNTEEGKPGKPVDAKSLKLLARFKRGRFVVPYRRPVGVGRRDRTWAAGCASAGLSWPSSGMSRRLRRRCMAEPSERRLGLKKYK